MLLIVVMMAILKLIYCYFNETLDVSLMNKLTNGSNVMLLTILGWRNVGIFIDMCGKTKTWRGSEVRGFANVNRL